MASCITCSATAAINDTEVEASFVELAVLAGRYRLDGRRDVGLVADFLDLAAALLRDEVERA